MSDSKNNRKPSNEITAVYYISQHLLKYKTLSEMISNTFFFVLLVIFLLNLYNLEAHFSNGKVAFPSKKNFTDLKEKKKRCKIENFPQKKNGKFIISGSAWNKQQHT